MLKIWTYVIGAFIQSSSISAKLYALIDRLKVRATTGIIRATQSRKSENKKRLGRGSRDKIKSKTLNR